MLSCWKCKRESNECRDVNGFGFKFPIKLCHDCLGECFRDGSVIMEDHEFWWNVWVERP